MSNDPAAPVPLPKAPEEPVSEDAVPTAPMSGHAATDTAADAADEAGAVKATRKMPEPDSLGG